MLGSQLDSNARPSRLKFDGLPPEPSNSSLLFPIVTRVIRDLFQTVFSQLIKVSRTDLARAARASLQLLLNHSWYSDLFSLVSLPRLSDDRIEEDWLGAFFPLFEYSFELHNFERSLLNDVVDYFFDIMI